jgi:putative FmdB family regulatory protein
MPIYAYKCGSCGHAKDVLQKLSDEPLTVCPSCGAAAFAKQLTAAGFQLKGSGWYATDFRNGSKPATANGDKADTAKPAEGASTDGAKTGEGGKPAESKPAESKPAESKPAAPKSDAPAASAGGCGAGCACH